MKIRQDTQYKAPARIIRRESFFDIGGLRVLRALRALRVLKVLRVFKVLRVLRVLRVLKVFRVFRVLRVLSGIFRGNSEKNGVFLVFCAVCLIEKL